MRVHSLYNYPLIIYIVYKYYSHVQIPACSVLLFLFYYSVNWHCGYRPIIQRIMTHNGEVFEVVSKVGKQWSFLLHKLQMASLYKTVS